MEHRNALASELYTITTPYKAKGFKIALEQAGLTSHYPNLLTDIPQGLPIGKPPLLTHTFVPPNMKLALQHPQFVNAHIPEEIEAGHMSGPFTLNKTHFIFKGHFHTTPMGVIEKEPRDGKFRLIRSWPKKDADGVSGNDMLNSDDFLTCWGSAWVVEQYVSPMMPVFTFHISIFPCHICCHLAQTVQAVVIACSLPIITLCILGR
jgi:hypothetical protein